MARMGTLLVGTLAFFLGLGRAAAQLPMDIQGLRGGRYVGSAAPVDRAPRAILGLGYAYTDSVYDGAGDKHHRLSGSAAAAWAPWSYLQLSLGFDARFDAASSESLGADTGGALGTRLATRHAFKLDDHWSFAARTALRFPPAKTPGRGFKGVSPELGVIGTYLFAPDTELSLDVGYRIDRSAESVKVRQLTYGDFLGAQVSDYDAMLLGLLYAMPVGPVIATAEWSWDIAVGSNTPSPLASPMRVRLGAQMKVKDRYLPGVELGISPSAHPSLAREKLVRIEPRFWFALTCGVTFGRTEPKGEQAEAPAPVVETATSEPARLEVTVLDANGAPVEHAAVQLAVEGERKEAVTDARGVVVLELREKLEHTLSVSGEGLQPQSVMVQGTPGRQPLSITMARALPEGEIKGTVRSLRGGQPVKARITIAPLGKVVNSNEKGNFVVDVPPGQYSLQIEAQGYEPQTRAAQVERLGVTIIVVDLRKAAK